MGGQNKIDLTGKKFGRWTVICEAGKNSWGQTLWQCICTCGKIKEVFGSNLKSYHSKSCGCLYKDIKSKQLSEMGSKQTGDANPNYIFGEYCGLDTKEARDFHETIRERDGHKCIECGMTHEKT